MEVQTKCPECGVFHDVDLDIEFEIDTDQKFEELVRCDCGCCYVQEVDVWITLDIITGKQRIVHDNGKEEVVFIDRYSGNLFEDLT